MLDPQKAVSYYTKPEVKETLCFHAKDREVGIRFGDKFGSRPDVMSYPNDVAESGKNGATSFHISEERWHDPMQLQPGMPKVKIDKLRSGWDFIIDIDCPVWEFSKIITHLLIKALHAHNIQSVTVKFSGNKGFHIGVPFEAFPKEYDGKPMQLLFPEAPRKMAAYLVDYINSEKMNYELTKMILEGKDITKISEITGKPKEELVAHYCSDCNNLVGQKNIEALYKFVCPKCTHLVEEKEELDYRKCEKCSSMMEKIQIRGQKKGCAKCGGQSSYPKFDPSGILEVDTVLISSRHLYRMPYSLHEKSGLASVPFDPHKVLQFEKEQANPEKITTELRFLDTTMTKPGEGQALLEAAYTFTTKTESYAFPQMERNFEIPKQRISQELFPPCIQHLSKGISDGKKRALFALINFLLSVGYSPEETRILVAEWNNKNQDALREHFVDSHLRYAFSRDRMMPPNCVGSVYKEIGICHPDNLCSKIKNPVQYAKRKAFFLEEEKTKKTKRQTQGRRMPETPMQVSPSGDLSNE